MSEHPQHTPPRINPSNSDLSPSGETEGPRPRLEAACREHLAFVRKNCPGLLPGGPVDPGVSIEPIPVDPKQATTLVRTAVVQAAGGGRPGRPGAAEDAVVWTDGTDSLLVLLDSVKVATGDGLVTVGIDVACDEAASAGGDLRSHVDVDLVVGTAARPTGLLAAATVPRGPAVVVDRWHDALVALAWQALLDAADGLSAAAGRDPDGAGLVPTGWSGSKQGLAIGAQARHPFDRQPATSRGSGGSR